MRKWTKEKIINTIIEYHEKGTPLNAKYLIKENKSLYEAGYRYFETWKKAIESAGLDYEMIRKDKATHSKKELIEEVMKYYDQGIHVYSNNILKINKELHNKAIAKFHSWKNVIEACGIEYESILVQKPSGFWTEERLIKEMKKIFKKEKKLNSKFMQDNYSDIYSAGCKLFDNWDTCIIKAGFELEKIKIVKKWNEEKVISEIKKCKSQNIALSAKNIRDVYLPLYKAAIRYFDNWKEALKQAGINVEDTQMRKEKGYWTKEVVIKHVKEMYRNGEPLNVFYVKTNHSSLYKKGEQFFDSWEKVVNQIGLDYDDVREDLDTTRYCGYLFQAVVKDLLTELNIPFKRKKIGELLPDFILKNNIILDAKLSEWSVFDSNTKKRYEPICSHLIILYMRKGTGNEKEKMISKKTRLVSVDNYIKQLPFHRQVFYNKRIEEINELLIKIES